MKLRLAYNCRFKHNPRITGVERFASEIFSNLGDVHDIVALEPPKGGIIGHLWEQLYLPIYSLFTGRTIVNPINTAPILLRNSVVVIHDLAFLHEPTWFSLPFRLYYSIAIPIIARNARGIITVSEFSKQEIISKLRINPNKIHVIHNGVSEHFKPTNISEENKNKYNIPEKYILYIGSLDPRKNISLLIDAFYLMIKRNPELPHKLVIVGAKHKNFHYQINNSNFSKLGDRIVFTGYVPDQVLPEIISSATLFAYFSKYEGFGLPPIEAAACGVPVLSSPCGAVPQILKGAARFIYSESAEEIATTMLEILINEQLRKKMQVVGLKTTEEFNWKNAATQMNACITSILHNNKINRKNL